MLNYQKNFGVGRVGIYSAHGVNPQFTGIQTPLPPAASRDLLRSPLAPLPVCVCVCLCVCVCVCVLTYLRSIIFSYLSILDNMKLSLNQFTVVQHNHCNKIVKKRRC